jgi:hypothetical protein
MAALQTGLGGKEDMVCLQATPRERAGSGISHSAYDSRKTKSVCTAVSKGCSYASIKHTNWNMNSGNHALIADIKSRGEKMIWIINIHDQRARETGERPARRLDWQKTIRQGGGGTVLAGDSNARSLLWEPTCTV